MNRKIKILQSVGSLGVGGNEIFVMNFFRHIDRDKFQVDFVIYDDARMDFYEEIINAGSKVYICKSKYKNKLIATIEKIIKLKKILKKDHYDIIHCHSCSFFGIFRGAIAGWQTKGVKIISHSHNPGIIKNTVIDKVARKGMKIFLSHIVDIGFACSDVAAESKYTDKFIKSEKFANINNAIDINKYLFNENVRDEMRKKYNIINEFVIGNVGRLEKQKNQKFLLDIFSKLKKINISAKLLVIGDGSLRKELENYAVEKGIENDVMFVGQVTESSRYYQMMDMFVMTSIYEGFPFVMVEAQANGLPAVVSSVITKSVNILGNVKFVDLEYNEKEWVDMILKTKIKRFNSESCKNKCKDYNLEEQAICLEKYYIRLLE